MSAKKEPIADFAEVAAEIHVHIAAGQREFALAAEKLIFVRKHCGRGLFDPWLDANGFGRSQAYSIMADFRSPEKREARLKQRRDSDPRKTSSPTRRTIDDNVIDFPVPDDEPGIEDEIDSEDPDNYRIAYLLRADQAIRFAAYSGPITSETVGVARRVAAAWTKLADTLEKSL